METEVLGVKPPIIAVAKTLKKDFQILVDQTKSTRMTKST